ncbi:DUF4278 domain-containing protein [Romeria aff. gracilis LEGE 07310]|uniref:DUF4278 domain-containing protein n=1 Tax=Vasconcelosia minhoensis LEGE 07310 TaxID=915328 RepID=A0A8J7AYD9_9CYAN|nr:DUF4278 domain-containing protein [Romeria gracilis]MBE9080058.1 DUF4278 domain-containing protein [Romeria aff. gracilis LEGE 07310]
MRLRYRGVEYDYNPPQLEMTESELLGQYRGRPTCFSYARHVPIPQPVETLTYRGVNYQTTSQGAAQALSETAAVRPSLFAALQNRTQHLSPAAEARRSLLLEASQTHRMSIQKSLQHRIEVAKSQGNLNLLNQLEDEMHRMV